MAANNVLWLQTYTPDGPDVLLHIRSSVGVLHTQCFAAVWRLKAFTSIPDVAYCCSFTLLFIHSTVV